MYLSTNFTLKEFVRSLTAKRKGIDNTPSDWAIENMILLTTNVLQPLRDWYKKRIHVRSGFRCKKLNRAAGGSRTSDHPLGKAGDIDGEIDNDNKILFRYILNNLPFDQLIWEFGSDEYPDWIHVSFRLGSNRNQVLKAIKKRNWHGKLKTKYIPFDHLIL